MARQSAALRVVDSDGFAEDLSEVQDFAESLPERYLHCRELGHNWRPFSVGRAQDGGFERVLRCTRCKTRRVQELTSWGSIVTNKYIHPDGYLHKGMGRIVGDGRSVLRLESVKRLVKATEED